MYKRKYLNKRSETGQWIELDKRTWKTHVGSYIQVHTYF